MLGLVTRPMLLLQNNWFNLQDYYEKDEVNYMMDAFGPQFYKLDFSYEPPENSTSASLSFHLTTAEKKGIANVLDDASNTETFKEVQNFLTNKPSISQPLVTK